MKLLDRYLDVMTRNYRLTKLPEDGQVYLRSEFFKYVVITVPLAILTVFVFVIIEIGQQNNSVLLVWAGPLIVLQLLRYKLARNALNYIHSRKSRFKFHILDGVTSVWWVGYLFMMGSTSPLPEEYLRRALIIFIVSVFLFECYSL